MGETPSTAAAATPSATTRTAAPQRASAPPLSARVRELGRRSWFLDLLGLAFVCLASLAIMVVVLKLWDDPDLHTPLQPDGDGLFTLSVFKGIQDWGWIWSNPSVGAPGGLHLNDFGALGPDNFHWALAWALSKIANQPGTIYNGMFFLTFPMSAGAAYLALRWLDISRLAAIAPAVLFSIAPYHFARGLGGHLLLADMTAVPFGVFLAVCVATGRPLWQRRAADGPRLLRWVSWTSARTLALCVLIASSGIYYAAFAIIFVVVAAFAAWLSRPDPKAVLLGAGAVLVALGAVLVFNLAPTVLYHHAHGPNTVAGQRNPNESIFYGLNLIGQVLPPQVHRFHPFATLGNEYWSQTESPGEGSTWGGTISVVGLALLIAAIAASLAGGARGRWLQDPRMRGAALVMITAALVGATGAGGAFISFIINPSLRAWDRIGIVLVFCGLLAFALGLDVLGRRVRGRPAPLRAAFVALTPVLILFGAWDQTWPAVEPDYKNSRAEWISDAHFVQKITASLGGRGSVYQIPYTPFPESPPVNQMGDYSPLKGFVHAPKTIKWSYASMKGRPEDWQAEASALPLPTQIKAAALAGFDGLWIDTRGYVNPDKEAVDPAARVTGVAPIISDDSRLRYFDLRPLRARLEPKLTPAERQAVEPDLTQPMETAYGTGFYQPESNAKDTWHWAAALSQITLDNPRSQPRRIVFEGRLSAATRSKVQLTLDGRSIGSATATPLPGRKVDQAIVVPPGKHTLGLSTNAPATTPAAGDTRDLRLQVLDSVVEDAEILALGKTR
ncbi:MAG TPA: hypothetical protein VI318_00390 [Baekduia sp.]